MSESDQNRQTREAADRKSRQADPGKSPVLELFERFGFSSLTEIQAKASPIILQKRDCLVVAPTGSGKTECSAIPIFSLLSRRADKPAGDGKPAAKSKMTPGGIRVLYITPLRALNRDVFRRITRYAQANGLDIGIRHGDTPQGQRKKMAENPPDVMITTPETLVVLLTQPKMLSALARLEWVVIDEVHELLSSKRGSQLSLSMERLELNARRPLTRVGLSATVGNVSVAAKFVAGTRRNCRIIRDRSIRRYDVEIVRVEGTISDAAERLYELIAGSGLDSPVLLFTNTRGEAEFMASVLREYCAAPGIPVELHHGSLSKGAREETEQALREGSGLSIVVCTSSLELGLDIGSVELVAHYGSPRQVSKFVQRIGRSRHVRGTSARGLIVTNSVDDELEAKAILGRVGKGSIEEQRMHDGPLDVLAHHLVGLSMQAGDKQLSVEAVLSLARQAYPFRNLQLQDVVDIIEQLDSNRLLLFDRDKMTFCKSGRYRLYHYENLSTIPDMLRFKVFDSVGRRIIGTLDQRFVGDHGEQGSIFVLRGSQWRILNVDDGSFIVNVEPLRGVGAPLDAPGTVPYWEGESMPVDYETARRAGALRDVQQDGLLHATDQAADKPDSETLPVRDHIAVESFAAQGSVVMHCCFGSLINSTLSALISSMLSGLTGSRIDSRSDAYRIVLSSPRFRISKPMLLRILEDRYDLAEVVGASLAGTYNINWRTWCVAKRFGVVGRDAIYDRRSAIFLHRRYDGTPLVREALRELFHDKYDLDGCGRILDGVRDGSIGVSWTEVSSLSRLAAPIMDHMSKYYSSPAGLDDAVLKSVKKRLEKTRHRIVCMRCGKWERLIETRDVKGPLACPHCRARQVTVSFHSDYDLPAIVRRRLAGDRLSGEEAHKFDRAWKVASLVESFGPLAVTVMSGYGVGADTAARILRNMVDEEHLTRQIYEAERQYVMTRGFWD